MKRIFIVAIAASLLVSCSSKEISLDEPSLLSRPLVVQSSLLNDEVTTKATTITGDIGVFRLANSTYGYTASDNIKYSYNSTNSSWATDPLTTIYLSGNNADIIGYYPHDINKPNCKAIPLTSKISTDVKDDLCYQKVTTSSRVAGVTFTFTYAYAKVLVNIKKTNYLGTGNITNITLKNSGIYLTRTLDMSLGTYPTGTTGNLSLTPTSFIVPTYNAADVANTVKNVKVLMIPCTLSGGLSIALTVDGQIVACDPLNLTSLEAGKVYNCDLTLTGTATGFAVVKCTDWDVVTPPVLNPIIN